jgi:hypothetical protein
MKPFFLIIAQLAVAIALTSAALLVVTALELRSYINLVWMIGIPFAVAFKFDRLMGRDDSVWPLKGLYLLICSVPMTCLTAVALGIGS